MELERGSLVGTYLSTRTRARLGKRRGGEGGDPFKSSPSEDEGDRALRRLYLRARCPFTGEGASSSSLPEPALSAELGVGALGVGEAGTGEKGDAEPAAEKREARTCSYELC